MILRPSTLRAALTAASALVVAVAAGCGGGGSGGSGVPSPLAPFVFAVTYSPDGSSIATGIGVPVANDPTLANTTYSVRVINSTTGASRGIVLPLGKNRVASVAWSPDGRHIATGSWDNIARIWNASTGALEQTLTGHTSYVYNLAFSPDSATLASSGWDDMTVRLWNVSTGAMIRSMPARFGTAIGVAWVPGTALPGGPTGPTVAGTSFNTLVFWDPANGSEKATFTSAVGGALWSVASAAIPGGAVVATGGDNGQVYVGSTAGPFTQSLTGATGTVYSVAISPNGTLVAAGGSDHAVRVWNVGGTLRWSGTHTRDVFSVAFSPDGSTVASGSTDGRLILWNASTGAQIRSIDPSVAL